MLNKLQENLSEVSQVKEALEKELQILVSTCWESESQGLWPFKNCSCLKNKNFYKERRIAPISFLLQSIDWLMNN